MEVIFRRFPRLGKGILDQVDEKTLVKSRELNRTWRIFIDGEKTIWLRMIQKHITDINITQDWQIAVFKIPIDTLRELAMAVSQFYKSEPARFDKKWSPLHITVEQGIFHLSQDILRKVKEKNPPNKNEYTPLQVIFNLFIFFLNRYVLL